MAILMVVLAVLVVSYASSMRAYLEQRHHIASLKAEIVSSQSDIDRLRTEKKRWKDPAYVETQAKLRFGWVMPGDTAYQVIGKDGKPLEDSDRLADADTVVRTTPKPWWSKEYDSLQQADHPPAATPTPATTIRPQSK
ncbi:FtsB family cell division protein [Nocardioides mangrovicus]|nr:septum formation initiator family protein [Nocardioides mangrovicus]